jgi:thymidylate kinase
LITVSGMVGSGKSTAAHHIVARLAAAGVPCEYVRFRFLSRGSVRRRARSRASKAASGADRMTPRAAGFRMRRLTVSIACGYLARILLFRLFAARRSSPVCYVVDRYFYDSLVHYALRGWDEQLGLAVLRRAMPVPDLALLLTATPATILRRRPDYAPEYVAAATIGYTRLPTQFPHLVAIATDGPQPDHAALDDALQAFMRRWRYAGQPRSAAGTA